jgi:predicted nucleic acid-binding protein
VLSADTNLFLYAANPNSRYQAAAREFFDGLEATKTPFATCELVLIALYMPLRNPATLAKPLSAEAAAEFCQQLRNHPRLAKKGSMSARHPRCHLPCGHGL